MGWQVVLTDHVFPSLDPVQQELASIGAQLQLAHGEREALVRLLPQADAVLNTYLPLDASLIGLMQRCRIIARMGIGVDNVDVEAATARGIWVTNVPDYCVEEVADHTWALILALVRKVAWLNGPTHQGAWSFQEVRPIPRLQGLVLGLVGFGRIGRRVADRGRAFGMRVVAYDPYLQPQRIAEGGAEPVDFDRLLQVSDVVSVHSPLTPQTRHLLDGRALSRMKPGAFVVNTSRGGIVDEQALRQALDSGHLAGAALDVLEREGAGQASPLHGHPRVILTPHVAFFSEESVVDLQRKAARQVTRVLAGQEPDYPVNRPARPGPSPSGADGPSG